MATGNLGYEIVRNLQESENDREALNNLGGGTIADDIELFVNNLRNTSELFWKFDTDDSEISNDKFVFQLTEDFVFTNGDKVMVSGSSLGNLNTDTMYHVVEYDQKAGARGNQLAFGLSLTSNGSKVSVGTIEGDVTFTRADPVSFDNLLNIGTPFILDSNAGQSGDDFGYDIGDSFNDAFDSIESNIDGFNFLRGFKYVSNDSISTDRSIRVEGTITVSDPVPFNDSELDLSEAKSPGVYISNPFSDILNIAKTRAFSSDANPWEEGTGELVTKSEEVNIGDLFFADDIKFAEIDDVASESGSVSEFTHKIPIVVDGVEYFVLLKS